MATLVLPYLGNQTNPAGKTHNFHARSYDAANGRFLSEDPVEGILTQPETLHAFAYGANNPYANPDPSGLAFWDDPMESAQEGFDWACGGLPVCSTRLYYLEHPKEDFSWKQALWQTGSTTAVMVLPEAKFSGKIGSKAFGKLKNSKAFKRLKDQDGSVPGKNAGSLPRPHASNSRLENTFTELFRRQDEIPGGTAGILRIEGKGGQHVTKVQECIININKIIREENLSSKDYGTARRVQEDLKSALREVGERER